MVQPVPNPTQGSQLGWVWVMLGLLWVALIFGTSCTVIRPQEFFDLIQAYMLPSEEAMRRFALFWGVCWFGVVKGWHFAEFAILTWLTSGVLRWWNGATSRNQILAAIGFGIAFAISDEWHQTFVPDRNGTISDVLIDSLGVLTTGIVLLLRQRQRSINPANFANNGIQADIDVVGYIARGEK